MSNLKDKQGEEEVKEANWKEEAKRNLVRYFSNDVDGGYTNAEICFSMVFIPMQSELTRLTEENERLASKLSSIEEEWGKNAHLWDYERSTLLEEKTEQSSRIQELEQGIREADEYLSQTLYEKGKPIQLNSIGAGSKLHKLFSSLLSSKDKTE